MIYSPSQTETFLFCPTKRELQYVEHRVPRLIGKRDISALMGRAVAAGIAAYHEKQHPEQSIVVASDIARRDLQVFVDRKMHFDGTAQLMIPRVLARVEHAVQRIIQGAPVPREWPVLAVEHSYPQYGNMRPDLIVMNDAAQPMVIDYKLKITLDARYRLAEEMKYARSWQMFHYAHFIGIEYNAPVQEYGIVLTVLEPRFSTELLRYPINPEALDQWRAFAKQTWARMARTDAGDEAPEGQTNCRDQYGPCPYLRWCWEFFGNENLANQEYERSHDGR